MSRSRTDEFLEFAAARSGHLFRSACLLTSGDTHLAEDLVQETLGRMYALWGRTGPIGRAARIDNPAAYAQTVLVRVFLSHRRRRAAAERPLGELPDSAHARTPGDDPALRVALLDALAALAPKDRAVVVLRYWEDRSIEETARALQVSSAAVRTRSVRALARLRERLGGGIAEYAAR
ncbi:SigE family RNA polymerase sigma factor [Streptomyces roseolilacinus]|uniref:RNA polymerase sigma24 factor n=1 Tax=Streptomyces roseolilacinus TaxID=66904 RepID=A0A918B5P6_9ACTN|nr:SigE family RNA polymerase sigma factor [Streptomyces roseolilacinus]GGQ28599.1 RNA polymerase sigma24 factor [Streptomyces roseolilacinus]